MFIQKLRFRLLFLCVASTLTFTSCFTGIESTKKIELSREDRKALQPSEEDLLMADVRSAVLRDWHPGKEFICADNKSALIFSQEGLPADIENVGLKGKTLRFRNVEEVKNPDDSREAVIIFTDGTSVYRYKTSKSTENALSSVSSADIPMMIDKSMVDRTDSLLSGRTLWIRTALWNDANGEKINGMKFIPVTVSKVMPGDIAFPILIKFRDGAGNDASIPANYVNSDGGARSFSSLFSLSDPHKRYPGISNEVWRLIQQGKIAEGMTKEECRLSIGNPSELDRGHTWDVSLDYWGYPDGSFIMFRDGVVVNFRKI